MPHDTASRKRIAIIGAGSAGACTALELAARGHSIDLFERHDTAVSQAGFANEGKIHLGFIYAKDRSLATARQMIRGALEFAANLRRWLPFDSESVRSTPFHYGVHRGSLMDPDELASHYARCHAHYDELARATGLDYLDLGAGSRSRRLTEAEYPPELDPEPLDALFETTEYAIDPRAVAEQLRKAIASEPRITLRLRQRVLSVRPERRRDYLIRFEQDGEQREERFSDVANTSWFERLPIDRSMKIFPPAPWSHRYKFGHRISIPLRADTLPSCTYVQGPFGDIVNFGERGMFLSWYPTGRTGMSVAETPPDWHASYSPDERMAIFERSFDAWVQRCPGLARFAIDRSSVDPYGGVIYALGTTDVDDAKSHLHRRFEIGIQSRDRYHSLDPGKYTLVPYWAIRLADQIDGVDR